MHRAWVALLLAGCGFSSDKNNGMDHDVPDAAMVDALEVVTNCWTIDDNVYKVKWSKCTTSIAAELHIASDRTIDTSDASQCAVFAAGGLGEEVCALVAKKIVIDAKATLRATGKRPLALFGNTVEIQGKVDVASYAGQTAFGAGANDDGCNPVLTAPAGESGGGAGGSFDGEGLGKDGGDGGGSGDTRGKAGGSISVTSTRGGCFGRRGGRKMAGGGSSTELGGAGGGVVWIAANAGTLTIGPTAVINASGAGGRGGTLIDQGGDGGGSGGLIVLQADTINFDAAATVFANGGAGGNGADGNTAGANGLDPNFDGTGSGDPSDSTGAGGRGYPDAHEGESGVSDHGGGGGGGGGAGAIRFVMLKRDIPAGKIRPTATRWNPRTP